MAAKHILVADSSEDFLLAVAQALPQHQVCCCQDGQQALMLLREKTWDLLILDLMLPLMDGITLLEILLAEGCCPSVLATTRLYNQYVLDASHRLKIGYLIRKPCTVAAVAARAADLMDCSPQITPCEDRRRFLSALLLSFGLSTKHDGFQYLLEGILSYCENPDQAFTKELYPAVGKPFGRSGNQVERSVRNALDASWACGNRALWLQYFPNCAKRPTAAQFITRLSVTLRQRRE